MVTYTFTSLKEYRTSMLVKKQLYLFIFSAACCFLTALNFYPHWILFGLSKVLLGTLGPSILKLYSCAFVSAPSLSIRDDIFLFPPKLQPWHFQFRLRRLFFGFYVGFWLQFVDDSFSWISDQSCSLPRISFFVIEEFEATPGNFSRSAATKSHMLVTDFFSLLL